MSGTRILIYSHFFAPSIGGVEAAVLSLARGLAEGLDGQPPFEVTVVTKTAAQGHEDSAYPFRLVRSPGLFGLLKLVRRSDLVHIAGPALLPLFLATLFRKPRVIEHHGYQAICPSGMLLEFPERAVCPGHFQAGRYRKCVRCQRAERPESNALVALALVFPRRWLAKKASANVAISDHVLRRHGLPASRRIYYGVPDLLETEISGPRGSSPFRFAYVGRFVPEKGVAVLLRAADILRDEGREFELVLIGDGPERPEIEAFLAGKGLTDRVRLTGYLAGEALAKTLAGVQVVIMPSVCEETAGLSAIEQMMRGRLVIASAIGGLGEVVGDAGLLCAPGDPGSLASQMARAMDDQALGRELGPRGRARATELFSRKRMVSDHASLYRSLLHS
jgi:glycogen synthase